MIKSIRIKKFRKLENVNEENIGLINELYGSNGSGKTSFISFISWILWGETLDYGKNDDMNIDTFKPFELIGGEIEFDNDFVLAREYGYDELGKKTNDFFVNSRKCKNQSEYYTAINNLFKLDLLSNLKIKDFNLQRAFSDPYYLPNKENQFRELISHLVNVDTYSILFENEKYAKIKNDYDTQGDYEKTNDFYNQTIRQIEKDIIITESKISEYSRIKFDEKRYNELQVELDNVKNAKVDNNEELSNKLNVLNDIQQKLIESKNNDIANRTISKEEQEKKDLLEKQVQLNNKINEINYKNIEIKFNRDKLEKELNLSKEELDNVKASKFTEIKCPKCDTLINEEDYKVFNKNKANRIKTLNDNINRCQEALKQLVFIDIEKTNNELNAVKQRLNALETILNDNPINYTSEQTKALEKQFNELYNEYNVLKLNNEAIVNGKREKQREDILRIENEIRLMKDDKDKIEALKILKENKKILNENKGVYVLRQSLLKEFKLNEISIIKEYTSKIFGNDFDFEMLVKNQTNDNYKKVCYASVDGLEHNKSNTAKYLKLSIMMLEKLKSYIGGCNIPIIFDIADNIGKSARNDIFETIKNSQIFYTRIDDNDNVERKINIIKEI